MQVRLFTLDGRGRPVPCENEEEWRQWFARPENRLPFRNQVGVGTYVQTAFCGTNLGTEAEPVWFWSVILGGWSDGEDRKTATIEAARVAHDELLKIARGG